MHRLFLLAGLSLFTACADDGDMPMSSPCSEDTRAGTLAVGDTFQGQGLTIEVTSMDPAPPEVGLNTWVLDAGDLAEDCTLTVEPFMPDHGHGADSGTLTRDGASVTVTDLELSMGGYWEVQVTATCGDDVQEAQLALCVDA